MADGALNGKAALVTGATRGIGAAVARALDAAGARVALAGRDRALLDGVAAGLTRDPVVLTAELRDAEAAGMLAAAALDALGTIDILVNNAATATRVDTTELTAEMIDTMYAVNVRAPLLLIGAVVPAMRQAGGGSIINLSSVSGVVGTPRRSAYGATKGAIDAATRSLAMELGPDNIRVNAVAPGVVDTQLWAKNKAIPGVVEQVEQQTPLGRWATPEDVADAIVFLATPASRFITGETICVDGGMARTFDLYSGSV